MPSNNTENIYATGYGGNGEPIPAAKISYDKTGTGISSENAQGAISELAIAVKDKYVITNPADDINITADGVKDYAELFDDLYTAFLAKISALATNEAYVLKGLFIEDIGTLAITGKSEGYVRTDVTATVNAFLADVTATTVEINSAQFGETSYFRTSSIGTTPAVTITDNAETVPTADKVIRLEAYKVKKL